MVPNGALRAPITTTTTYLPEHIDLTIVFEREIQSIKNCYPNMAASWSGLMKIYLGREREKTGRSSRTGSQRVSAFVHGALAKPSVMRFMPSYRLEPHNPLNREQCEKILKSVVDKSLEEFVYSSKQAEDLSAQLSEEIKNRVKAKNYDRYRFICVVTIGEKCMQGFKSVATFLWDGDKDGYVNYVYDNPDFFANVTLYYLYYD